LYVIQKNNDTETIPLFIFRLFRLGDANADRTLFLLYLKGTGYQIKSTPSDFDFQRVLDVE
ncbi:MAG: hypothetical protein WBO60_07950, partial [Streptococcus suis]